MQSNGKDDMQKIVVPTPETLRLAEDDSLEHHPPKNLRQRVVRGGSLTLVVRFVVQLITWLTMFIVLRLLTPADYGVIMTAGVFLGIADILAHAGLNRALVQKKRVTHTDMAATFTLCLLLSGGLYLIIWALSAPVAKYLEAPDLGSLLRFMALVLLLIPLRVVGIATLSRQLRLGTLATVQAGSAIVQSGILVLLAFQGYGAWALALSFVCGHIMQASLIWYVSGSHLAMAKPSADTYELLRYGLTVTAGTLVWYFFETADVAVISAVLGPVQLGYYALALLIVTAPREKISVHVNHIMFVAFCKLQNDRQRMRRWFMRLLVLQLLIICPAFIGFALVADDAILLTLGEKWQSAVLLTQLLAPVGILLVVASSFVPLFTAIGRADINFKFHCTCAASLIVAFLIVSQFFGLVGVCLVWLTLYPLLLAVMIQLTSSITTITLRDVVRASTPVLLATFFMVIVVASVGYFLPDAASRSLRLAAMIAGGIVAYSVWLLAFARELIFANISVLASELGWRRSAASEEASRTAADPQN